MWYEMTLPSVFFGSERDRLQPLNNEVVGDSILKYPKPLGPIKISDFSALVAHPALYNKPRQMRSSRCGKFCNLLHHVPEQKTGKTTSTGSKRTVYAWWRRSCRSRHLSREAGAFDGLGSLFDLVLVAAAVCGDYLACSCFHVNWKHKIINKLVQYIQK